MHAFINGGRQYYELNLNHTNMIPSILKFLEPCVGLSASARSVRKKARPRLLSLHSLEISPSNQLICATWLDDLPWALPAQITTMKCFTPRKSWRDVF